MPQPVARGVELIDERCRSIAELTREKRFATPEVIFDYEGILVDEALGMSIT